MPMTFFNRQASSADIKQQLSELTSRHNAHTQELTEKRSELNRLEAEHRRAAMEFMLKESAETNREMVHLAKQINAAKERIEVISKLVEAGEAVRTNLQAGISLAVKQETLASFDKELPALFNSCTELETCLKRVGELLKEQHGRAERLNSVPGFESASRMVSLYSQWQYWMTAAVSLYMGGILPTVPGGMHGEAALRGTSLKDSLRSNVEKWRNGLVPRSDDSDAPKTGDDSDVQ